MMELPAGFRKIKQGAEARMYVGSYLGKCTLVKERFEKKYRHPILDANITKDRIKAEVRAIMRCKVAGIPTPAIYLVDFGRRCIFMEFITGYTVKEYIETLETEMNKDKVRDSLSIESLLRQLGIEIGQMIGRMHSSSIIHGDLTSSNILICLRENGHQQNAGHSGDEGILGVKSLCRDTLLNIKCLKLVLIDFGLSKTDSSPEDKGVDLYVLERALLSTHPLIAPKILFPEIIKGYIDKCGKSAPDVLAKLDEVRMRGRKRTMVG